MSIYNVFTDHYTMLCDTLTDLLQHFVQKRVIKADDLGEINAIIPSIKKHKVQKLMEHILGPLKAGNSTGAFYVMLEIMGEYGHQATQ